MNRKDYKKLRLSNQLENRSNNMIIHGYLQAIQDYVCSFGLEGTAAYILSKSGIDKDDFIRCQIESGYETQRMLSLIEKAFQNG